MKHRIRLSIADMADHDAWHRLLFQLDIVGTIHEPDQISMTVDDLFLEVVT